MKTNLGPATTRTTPTTITSLYQQRARNYDFTANLYYLVGFWEQAQFRILSKKLLECCKRW